MSNKIIRNICYFTKEITDSIERINKIASKLLDKDYVIQTKRICSPLRIKIIQEKVKDKSILLNVGTLSKPSAINQFGDFKKSSNVSFNIDLSKSVTESDVQFLFKLIKECPEKTFNFAYVFNNVKSTPYFPSANYYEDGFSIGLQSTDLALNCSSLDEWLSKMKIAWNEIYNLFKNDKKFLGIDSSIAPLYKGKSSLINFIKKLGFSFSESIDTDTYIKMTDFIKKSNPKPVGLCGLMLPCLEDFELADEYEKGNFSVERNIFLSLQSGLGVDTYPVGIDENPDKILNILLLIQGLSNKYKKPLSVRFVSDGKARIGKKTRFNNEYLRMQL